MSDDGFEYVILILAIIIGVPWAIWNYDLNPLSDEISVYPQEYKCRDNANKTGCKWVNLPYKTYKVNYEAQTILYWWSDKTWPVKKSEDCNVASKKHWTCGDYYIYGFNNGIYSIEDTKQRRYISKTWWWYHDWL